MNTIGNRTNTQIIKVYDNIIKELIAENLIEFNTEIEYPNTVKSFIEKLFNFGINENIIYLKISKHLELDIFKYNEKDKENYIINDLGIIFNSVFYLRNPLSNVSRNIIKRHKEYAFFESIGIIKETDFSFILNYKKKSIDKFSSYFFLINIIEKAINKEVNEIFIQYNEKKRDSDIIFNYNNNYFKIEEQYEYSDLPEIEDIINFNGKDYFIELKTIKESDKKLFFIYINEYKVNKTIVEYDKKYNKKIMEMLTSSSGLFLLSEKNESDLYYILMEELTSCSNKKIISFEKKIKANVENVFQTKKIITGSNLSLFDVIFVKNVNTEEEISVIVEALQLGKLVIVSTVSQDSLIALSSLIANFDIDKYLLSEKILGVYHSTILPEVCDSCSIDYPIKESLIAEEEAFETYKMSIESDHLIRKAQKEGCSKCLNGYTGGTVVSELLTKDKDVATEIEGDFNIRQLRNLKESKRWETVYSYSRYLVAKKTICIKDVKNIL